MTYKAERNNGGEKREFDEFDAACEWVADGSEFEEVENGENSVYIFPEGSEDNNDCLGAVDTIDE